MPDIEITDDGILSVTYQDGERVETRIVSKILTGFDLAVGVEGDDRAVCMALRFHDDTEQAVWMEPRTAKQLVVGLADVVDRELES